MGILISDSRIVGYIRTHVSNICGRQLSFSLSTEYIVLSTICIIYWTKHFYSTQKGLEECVREETFSNLKIQKVHKLIAFLKTLQNDRKVQPCDQANRWQKLGLVWRNRKKISQIINAYLYLPILPLNYFILRCLKPFRVRFFSGSAGHLFGMKLCRLKWVLVGFDIL